MFFTYINISYQCEHVEHVINGTITNKKSVPSRVGRWLCSLSVCCRTTNLYVRHTWQIHMQSVFWQARLLHLSTSAWHLSFRYRQLLMNNWVYNGEFYRSMLYIVIISRSLYTLPTFCINVTSYISFDKQLSGTLCYWIIGLRLLR